jgi:hypothetical protein
LEAIDDFIDALMTPKNEVGSHLRTRCLLSTCNTQCAFHLAVALFVDSLFQLLHVLISVLQVVGAFPTAVKAFFRESNLDLEPRRVGVECMAAC